MNSELAKKYKAKAKDSFKTKINLFLFQTAILNGLTIKESDYNNFTITEEIVKQYTSEYWQQHLDYTINGLKISDIEKHINLLNEKYVGLIKELEIKYVNSFSDIFPEANFEKLLSKKDCHYCEITVEEIEKLAEKRSLYKKSFRGWNLEIDRLNSNFEYTYENCVMSCYWCNNAKTDEFSESEFLKIGNEIKKVWEGRLK